VSLAKLVEQLGFHTLSIYDDLFFKPAWPILSIVAANTSTIRVGPAVVNPYLIHPAITAGNIALLDEISGGRAYLGIGKGAFLDFVGVETPTPITAVRETIDIVQRLLDGSMKGYKGDFFNIDESASFRWKPVKPKVPIVIGTWGQRMAELAGKVADEVKANPLWDAGYATQLLTYIHKGAAGAGRDINDVSLCLGVLTSVSEDEAEAREYARRALAIYLPHLSPMTEAVGVSSDEVNKVSAYSSVGDYAKAARYISDRTLENFALFGTPGLLCRKIQKMLDQVPVDRIEFGTPHGPDSITSINLLGRKVLPWFS
jgi:5,10-methylenetetrahydromethanopterin reductase